MFVVASEAGRSPNAGGPSALVAAGANAASSSWISDSSNVKSSNPSKSISFPPSVPFGTSGAEGGSMLGAASKCVWDISCLKIVNYIYVAFFPTHSYHPNLTRKPARFKNTEFLQGTIHRMSQSPATSEICLVPSLKTSESDASPQTICFCTVKTVFIQQSVQMHSI
mmetsp:Transcript_59783/g.124960  ORF Transcript_59783/g.124960 Transcript_59783/m.124960 type:complete len:167 (-) Transcript_59783:77-577(-)